MVEERRWVCELGLGLKKSGPSESVSERRSGDTVDEPIGKKDFHSSENSIVVGGLLF
jgi:hypothetical protein